MNAPSSVRAATALLLERYLTVVLTDGPPAAGDKTGPANLAWLCRTALAEIDVLPIDKLSRWLGFVQGVLAARGQIDVDEERVLSRPLFHAAYRAENIVPPAPRQADQTIPGFEAEKPVGDQS